MLIPRQRRDVVVARNMVQQAGQMVPYAVAAGGMIVSAYNNANLLFRHGSNLKRSFDVLSAGYKLAKRKIAKLATQKPKPKSEKNLKQTKMVTKSKKAAPKKSVGRGPAAPAPAPAQMNSNAAGLSVDLTKSGGRKRVVKKPTLSAKVDKLARKVGKLNAKAKQFTWIRSTLSGGSLTSAINLCKYTSFLICDRADMDYAAQYGVNTFGNDNANTATRLEILDITQPTGNKASPSVHVKTIRKVVIKNNSYGTCHINANWMQCTHDTADPPETELSLAGTNINVTSADTNPAYYMSDFQLFSWKSYESAHCILQPGDEVTFFLKGRANYNPDMNDDEAKTYISGKTKCLLIRQIGCVAHDSSTNTLVGYANTILDYVLTGRTKVKTPSPATAKQFVQSNNLGAISAAAVMSRAVDKELPATN